MNLCKNCSEEVINNYCGNCGQKSSIKRLNIFDSIKDSASSVLNVEKGLIRSTVNLMVRPGNVVREYISGKRIKYFPPFRFLVIFVGLNALLILNIPDFSGTFTFPEKFQKPVELLSNYLELFTILSVPILSFFSYIFFKSYKYNFTEHLVLNAYTTGVQAIVNCIFIISFYFLNINQLGVINPTLFSIIYFYFMFLSFFNKRWYITVLLSTIAMILTYAIWMMLILGILSCFL